MILNKKKGVVFPYLIALFMIVLFFTFLSFFIHKPQSDINRLDYGALTKSADIQQNVILSYSYTYDEMVDRLYNEAQSFFLNYVVSMTEKQGLEKCSLAGEVLVFDARTTQTNEDVYEKCLEILIEKDKELSEEFQYEELFRVLVDSYLANIYSFIKKDIEGFDIITRVDFNEDKNIYNVEIEYLINFNSNIAKGSSKKISRFEFDGGSFLKMIENMVIELPNLNNLNTQISNCMSSGSSTKEVCIESSMESYLEGKLTDDFSYEVIFLNDLGKSFYQIRVDVFEKSRVIKNPVMSFSGVFEDRAPLGYPSFNLNYPKFDEKLFQVEIEKPENNFDLLDGFLILYSYDDFVGERYVELENSLESGNLSTLTSSKEFEIKNYENLNYSVFSVDDVSGLTGIYLKNNNLEFNNNNKLIVPINQIYNSTSGNFEFLENRQINVFVFSLRETQTGIYDYLLNQNLMKNLIKFTLPTFDLSLPPIDFKVNNIGNNLGVDYGINISFSDYNHEYDNLEYFITTDKDIDFRDCENLVNCFKLTTKPTKKGEYSFLLYSSEGEINSDFLNKFDVKLTDSTFLNGGKLQNGETLYVLVLAISSFSRNPLDVGLKKYKYSKKTKDGFNYIDVEKLDQNIIYGFDPKEITIRELNP